MSLGHADVAPVDLDNFQKTLTMLRGARRSPRPADDRPRRPAFSIARVSRIVIPVALVAGFLHAFLTLLHAAHPAWALLLLAVGSLLALGAAVRSRRRASPSDAARIVATDARTTDDAPGSPAADDRFEPSDDRFPLRAATPEPAKPPLSNRFRFLLFAVSLTACGAIAAAALPELTPTWIALVVLLHEAGHLAAMHLLGYSDLTMILIPFVGGAAGGRKTNASPSEQLITLLAGPAPGLLIGCLIF